MPIIPFEDLTPTSGTRPKNEGLTPQVEFIVGKELYLMVARPQSNPGILQSNWGWIRCTQLGNQDTLPIPQNSSSTMGTHLASTTNWIRICYHVETAHQQCILYRQHALPTTSNCHWVTPKAKQHSRYHNIATQYLTRLMLLPPEEPLGMEYKMTHLAGKMDLNRTSEVSHNPTINKAKYNTNSSNKRESKFKYKQEVQCECCQNFGHNIDSQICQIGAQVFHSYQFMNLQPIKAQENAQAYSISNNKTQINNTKTQLTKANNEEIWDHLESMACSCIKRINNRAHNPTYNNNNTDEWHDAVLELGHLQTDQPPIQGSDTNNDGLPPRKLISILPSYHPPPELRVHQVHQENKPQFSLLPEINLDLTHIPATEYDTPKSSMVVRKIICIHWYAKYATQGDTGANCSATNNISLLWNYWPLNKPIPIVTYQGQDKCTVINFEAVGTGIIKMIVDDTTVNWLTLHTPNSTGTIISPDRYMMDNGHIHVFLQSGSRDGKGHLQFINSDGKTVAKVKMKRQRGGLWYTESPLLLSPPTLTNKSSLTDANLESTPIVHKVNKLDTSHQTRQHSPKSEDTMPTNTTTSVRTTTWTAQASQALKQLELWHQRIMSFFLDRSPALEERKTVMTGLRKAVLVSISYIQRRGAGLSRQATYLKSERTRFKSGWWRRP
jgi:hypothetical protein